MKKSHDHTQLTRLAAISLVMVMCLSATIPSVAQAAGGEPNPSDYKWTVSTPASGHDSLLQWTLVTDDAPNLSRIVMVDGTLYATSRDGKFYSSADGQAWTLLYDFPEEGNGANGIFLYYSHYWGRLFAVFRGESQNTGNLYMSTDLGRSWTISDRVPHGQSLSYDSMDESPDGILYYGQYGNTLYTDGEYLANHAYIRKSIDGGRSWSTETSIYTYHIHSVEVAHDGKVFASYGDADKGPGTRGMMVKENGVWSNVTSSIMQDAQPYGIARIGDYTFFGTDSYGAPSIMRYDGNDFAVSLDAKDPSKRFRLCYDIMAADDVIYALTFCGSSSPTPGGPLVGYDVWASPDMGDSWYRIQTLTYDQGVEGQIVNGLAVEDGSPYVFALSSSGTEVYRFNHLGVEGISQLMYGGAFAESDGKFTTSVTLANSGYIIPLASHWIRNPTITVTAKSLTNVFPNGQFDVLPGNYTIKPSWEADTSTYTTAPQSLKIDAGPDGENYIMIYPDRSGNHPGCKYLIAFDAKRDPSSGSFLLSGVVNFRGDPIQYGNIKSYFALTDEWRTYAFVSDQVAPTGYTGVELVLRAENPLQNQTANIDNVRAYVLDPEDAAAITPTGHYQAGVELQASDVRVTIDGQSYDLGAGPFADGEVIGTIQLTGDYKDSIDISAYCDGAVTITIEGERIGYASGLLPIHTDGGIWLRGGNADSYLMLYGTAAVAYAGAPNVISPTGNAIYQLADGDAFITPTTMSMSSTSYMTVNVLDWGSRSANLAVQAPQGAQTLNIGGLRSGSYLWYLDGVEQGEVKADKDGTIALIYTSTGLHTLEVKPTSMTAAMDGLAAAVGIVAVLAVLGGVLGMLGKIGGLIRR